MAGQKAHFSGMEPRFLSGVLEIPVYHMRGHIDRYRTFR